MAQYAVIKTGGKQHRVAADDVIVVERLAGEAGDQVVFDNVLLIGNGGKVDVGAPKLAGAAVVGEIAEQRKADKITIIKRKPRTPYRRKKGHRQLETVVRITAIAPDGDVKAAKPKAKKAEPPKVETKTETKTGAPAGAKAAAPKAAAKPAVEVLFLSEPDGAADDLKMIGGVGPALEKKLNAIGVYHFRQIAAFTAAEAAKVDEALSFKGRMEREDWIGQAKELMAGGEPRAKADKKAKAAKTSDDDKA